MARAGRRARVQALRQSRHAGRLQLAAAGRRSARPVRRLPPEPHDPQPRTTPTTAATGRRSRSRSGGWCRSCVSLGLPVKSRVSEDPERGVMFDFLRSPPGGPRVMTGHASGLITLNVEEADDATAREDPPRPARAVPHAARALPPRDRPLLLGPAGVGLEVARAVPRPVRR